MKAAPAQPAAPAAPAPAAPAPAASAEGAALAKAEPEKPAAPAAPAAAAKPAAPAAAKADGVKKASQTVRVDIGRLDKLMNLVGELVIGRARIERLVQEARLREFDEPLS